MKYFDLMSRFWEENKKRPAGSSVIAIYTYLAFKWDATRYQRFAISDLELSGELRIAINTLKRCRKYLRDRQLIEFTITPGSPCSYILRVQSPGIEDKISQKKAAESKKEAGAGPRPTRKKKAPEKPEKKVAPKQAGEAKPLPPAGTGTIQVEIPSFEEYLSYVKGLNNYVPEADPAIKRQYDSWAENGWNNPYNNTPITDWKGVLKNNLIFLIDKKEIEEIKLPRIINPKISDNE